MSRLSDKEQFPQLRRLLALKRHEQPTPGYYHGFSSQVIARIRAGERGVPDNFLQRLLSQAPWLERSWAGFANRPTLAGAFGAGVCALLVSMVIFSESNEPASFNSALGAPGGGLGLTAIAGISSPDGLDRVMSGSSTNPIPPSAPSPFNELELTPQPVNYPVPTAN